MMGNNGRNGRKVKDLCASPTLGGRATKSKHNFASPANEKQQHTENNIPEMTTVTNSANKRLRTTGSGGFVRDGCGHNSNVKTRPSSGLLLRCGACANPPKRIDASVGRRNHQSRHSLPQNSKRVARFQKRRNERRSMALCHQEESSGRQGSLSQKFGLGGATTTS